MAATDLSTLDRPASLAQLESDAFDLAVIGGGITGAGIAREAALRGLSVALLEAEDFASGTSSRSSKLIHGGLRYLAQGEVGLVRETALERKQVFRLAPHLAERRWMVLPTRNRAALLRFRAAITTYEKLGAVEKEDLHRNWSAEDLEREEPALDRSSYPWACAYREYLTDDARLVLANLRAAAGDGAAVLNHARVEAIEQRDGRACAVVVRCTLGGEVRRVRARCVVNAAGPWVEAVRRLQDPDAPSLLHLSKGVHVVLPASRVPVRNLLLVNAADRRSIFILRRGDIVFVGTTDTSYPDGAQVWPRITRADVEYLLEPLGRYLTIEPPGPGDVRSAWAGLRPLIAEPGKTPGEISRKDEILVGEAGVVTVGGGKLTGYRPVAGRTLEQVARVLDTALPPRAGEEPPLPGGDFAGDLDRLESELVRDSAVNPAEAARLARLYGTEARAVLGPDPRRLATGVPVFEGEVSWAVRSEGAARVEDVLYRRTRSALYDPEVRESIVTPIATLMAGLLDWSRDRVEKEVAAARARLAADLEFEPEPA